MWVKRLYQRVYVWCGRPYYWKPVQAGRQPCTDSEVIARFIPQSRIFPSAYVLDKAASPNQAARVESICLKKRDMLFSYFQQTHTLHSSDIESAKLRQSKPLFEGAAK